MPQALMLMGEAAKNQIGSVNDFLQGWMYRENFGRHLQNAAFQRERMNVQGSLARTYEQSLAFHIRMYNEARQQTISRTLDLFEGYGDQNRQWSYGTFTSYVMGGARNPSDFVQRVLLLQSLGYKYGASPSLNQLQLNARTPLFMGGSAGSFMGRSSFGPQAMPRISQTIDPLSKDRH